MGDASPPEIAVEQPDAVDQLAEGQLDHSAACILAADHLVASKRNNVQLAKQNTLVTSAGNCVIFYNIVTREKKYVLGRDGGGIGAIAVHPLEPLIAVAEQCKLRAPNVYIYRLSDSSELQLEYVLKAGTEHSYSAVAFNNGGNLLATVGGAPDYMLTLWDWHKESVILRHKAFSQEVYNASFSPFFDGKLITSGTGHIRMWKMAATFTGLKLVGLLGKFGQVELSDVCAYLEFPDGKVLSGTESGQLLLWAGNLIKAVFMRQEHKTCHDGNVEVLALHQGGSLVVSAGQDGYIRTWDASKINEIEPEDGYEVEIPMITEVHVPGGARIKSILDAGDCWMLQDESGSLTRVTVPEISAECMEFSKLWFFHSGGISRAVLDRESHCTVSVDTAGSIWAYDLRSREALAKRKFPQGITCLIRAHQSMDSNQSMFFLGHEHGFVRQVVRCSDGWRLAACVRAHKSGVLALCSSPSGGWLVSCGSDRTLFFFTINDGHLEALAFTVLPLAPTAVVWTSQGIIVGCENGTLLCVIPPESHDHVAAGTYELKAHIDQHEFQLPQSLWPPPPKKVKEEGEDGEEDDQADNEEEGQEADNWVPSPEEIGPFPIVALFQHPSDPARFLLSASGNGSCHLFDIRDIHEEASVHVGMSSAITSAEHSRTGRHFVTGSCDGAVRVTAVRPFTFPRHGDAFWESQVHDMHHRVTSACVTFDGSAVVSTASDGAMFSHRLEHESLVPGQPQQGLENDRFCMLEDCIVPEGEDIADSNAYTIEQAKQQLEKDMLMAAAEAKKTSLRQAVSQIKKEFEQLLAENAAKPEGEQLPLSYFDIDPGMREMIEEEVRQEEEQVRAEMQHELEKNTILLAKVKAKFLDPLEVERIELHALGQQAMVTSFRTPKLEDWVEQELHSMLKEKETAAATTTDSELQHDQTHAGRQWEAHNSVEDNMSTKHSSKNKQVSKHELRQQARAKRKAQWESFMSTKPDDNYVNPVDAEAIIEATRNMGDYKLKSEKSYVPDENKRMTPKRKKQQIALLLQGIFTVKMEFNERFLALRDVKQAVCAELQHKYNELEALNKHLGFNDVIQSPCMRPAEEPERREEVTDEDIASYMHAQEAAAESAAANNLDGFAAGGGAAGDKAATGDADGKPAAQPSDSKAPEKGVKAADAPKKAAGETQQALIARLSAQYPPTPIEKIQREIMERTWGVERDLLLKRIEEMTARFDEALMKLRREKIDLEMNLKAAEVQLLVLVQEHGLLVEFSAKDDALAGKLAEKQVEQREILSKINACQLQLKEYRNQLENVAKRKAEIAAYFDSVVNENHQHRDPLLMIFNRKVKRAKKSVANDRDDDDDEDADSDGEDDSDDDEQQETCPPGCDQALYDEVCVIREQRLDQEDVITDITKSCEQAKKEQETLRQKLKRIEQSLAATETDIREFQQEKQASLNEIDVMVMLHAHQIEYLVDGRLPVDLSGAVVFSNKELARLRKRIDELGAEKLQMRKTQKELRKQHRQLTKDKSAKEKILTDLEARAHDVQMLKFGREIDLDLLEQMGPTPGADELRAQLREQEKQFVAELKEWDQKISMRTEELVALTQENTIHLNTVGELTSQQKALESGIRRTRKELNSDPVAAQKREAVERDHLIQLIQSQAKEIDYIKSQIDVLKRKDTSVFQ